MKKLLLITSPRPEGWLEANETVAEDLKSFAESVSNAQVSMSVTTIDRLYFNVSQKKTTIWDDYNKVDIASFDIIHLRSIDKLLGVLDFAAAIVAYAKKHDILLMETVDKGMAIGKLSQAVIFACNGLAIPKTVVAWHPKALKKLALQYLDFPIIVKANHAMKGNDNHLVKDEIQLGALLDTGDTQYVAQEFIPNDGDYRVLFDGYAQAPIIFKRVASGDSHLNNTSRGSSAALLSGNDLGHEALGIAKSAACAVERTHTGIDLMKNSHSDEWLVLEANINPALSMGAFIEEKIIHYRNLIDERLKEGS